jgi:hypothetical protein
VGAASVPWARRRGNALIVQKLTTAEGSNCPGAFCAVAGTERASAQRCKSSQPHRVLLAASLRQVARIGGARASRRASGRPVGRLREWLGCPCDARRFLSGGRASEHGFGEYFLCASGDGRQVLALAPGAERRKDYRTAVGGIHRAIGAREWFGARKNTRVVF